MKTTLITTVLFILIMTGCKKDADIVKGFYDSMHFVREGGGQIEFKSFQLTTLISLMWLLQNWIPRILILKLF